MKNMPYIFKFFNFTSLHLFQRKIIVFYPSMMVLIEIAAVFHKLLKKNPLGCGWGDRGERPLVCDHLDLISNVLGALRTIQRALNSIYTEIL